MTEIQQLLVNPAAKAAPHRGEAERDGEVCQTDEAIEAPESYAFSCPVDHSGTSVYVQGWAPRIGQRTTPIVFVHDLAENVTLYERAAQEALQNGFNAYSFDMRGHGQSTPLAGTMIAFSDLINDLLQVVAWIRFKSGRVTPLLIGQGAGGLLILHFIRKYPQYCQAAVVLAPVLYRRSALPFFSRMFIRSMALLTPGMQLPTFLLPYFLPLNTGSRSRPGFVKTEISVRFARELLQAIHDAPALIREIKTQTLVLAPADDRSYHSRQVEDLLANQGDAKLLSFVKSQKFDSKSLTLDDPSFHQVF